MTDIDLVRRAQHGDAEAFGALAAASIRRLDAAARLILRDPDRAQDAVQEAYARAWRDLRGLREPDRFEAWLHRLLVRSCYDALRRERRRPIEVQVDDLDVLHGDDLERATLERDLLDRALHALDADERLIVVLFYYLDVALPEAAAALGIPVGTAKSRLHRARRLMREAVGADSERPDADLAGVTP